MTASHDHYDQALDRSASGELMLRAFGPLADALGQELAKAPSFVIHNLARLATVFQRKRKASQPGHEPSARLFKQIVEEAAWSEDEIIGEYLGGVLASSTSDTLRDRGVTVTATIRQLSAVQLRAHYIFYTELLRLVEPKPICDLRTEGGRAFLHLEMEVSELVAALGVESPSHDQQREIATHVVLGLGRQQLIDPERYHLPNWGLSVTGLRLGIHPSPLGAELYLWGAGSVITDQARLFDPALELVHIDGVPEISSAQLDSKTEAFDMARREIERNIMYGRTEQASKILHSASGTTNASSAAPHYYAAVLAALSGDIQTATERMRDCAALAKPNQIRTGLETLGKIADEHPSKRDHLLRLAEILESERRLLASDG